MWRKKNFQELLWRGDERDKGARGGGSKEGGAAASLDPRAGEEAVPSCPVCPLAHLALLRVLARPAGRLLAASKAVASSKLVILAWSWEQA